MITSVRVATAKFYSILGFEFENPSGQKQHLEAKRADGARLMIDSVEMIESILGQMPTPSNHSTFAIEYETPEQIDNVAADLLEQKYKVIRQPWDAVWGQRYCIVEDPDGYRIDLFCKI